MSCTHTAADMDTAAHFDGKCPICLFEKVQIHEGTIKAQLEAIETERRLRTSLTDILKLRGDEIKRLQNQNAELVEARRNLEVRLNAEIRAAAKP